MDGGAERTWMYSQHVLERPSPHAPATEPDGKSIKTPELRCMVSEDGRTKVLEDLELARTRTEQLICTLSEAQLDVPYHPGVNPPLWEMGHSAFFYEVFVFNLLDGTPSYDPSMDDLWDSFHVDHKDRWSRDLFPGREETLRYFNTIYDRVAERIKGRELTDKELYLYRRSEEHTSELQSRPHLVCRLLLEKKK